MLEIGLIIAIVMAIAGWLKTQKWFPNSMIPLAVIALAVMVNIINAYLFGYGDVTFKDAGKLALVEALMAIGIHSGIKNSFGK